MYFKKQIHFKKSASDIFIHHQAAVDGTGERKRSIPVN